ncbi:hypothetical protein [Acidithiobacillus sp.]|nr:hypothetical protein [Acidithiobacillus sp.]
MNDKIDYCASAEDNHAIVLVAAITQPDGEWIRAIGQALPALSRA